MSLNKELWGQLRHFEIIDYILCKQSDLWVERQTKYDKRRNKSNAQRYRE